MLTMASSLAQIVPQQAPLSEGVAMPRSLTPAEADWLRRNPLRPSAITPPPTGPLHCAAEYEPMDGIMLAWEGPSSWKSILQQMAVAITTVGQARAYVMVDSASEQSSVLASLRAAGADMARVVPFVVPTDTIWIRDYGPRYVFEGDCRVIVDHTYNRPRPSDNRLPLAFSRFTGQTHYEHRLVHGGGNYHLDARDRSYTTRLINAENPALTEPQIHQVWRDYQNVDTWFFDPLPRSVDSTQHLDMWMQVAGDDVVVISDWSQNSGSIQDRICDAAAVFMAGRGYTVLRVPARSVGGTHYTYTNVVLCNDLLLLPSYTQSSVVQHNAEALRVWRQALPARTIQQVNCQAIVTASGVMHCVAMHVPRARGNGAPTAYLRTVNGGETLSPGAFREVVWNEDDDQGVVARELRLSTDGGRTFPFLVATALPAGGRFLWRVPDLAAPTARLRVSVRDAQGNTGHDDSNAISRLPVRAAARLRLATAPGRPAAPACPRSAPRRRRLSTLESTCSSRGLTRRGPGCC